MKTMLAALVALLLSVRALPVQAAMVTRDVRWTLDGTHFRGVLIHDDASHALRPGLLMVPNWYGVDDDAIAKARNIAGDRYVILLADLYGEGVHPRTTAAAQAAVAPLYGDRVRMRARMLAALRELRTQEGRAPIDPACIAAIGFCFGG